MSREDVEMVRARYEEFARGDFSRMAGIHDDYEFVTTADMPDAGTYRGDAARRWVESWVGSFDGLTIEVTEIIDAGDKVFAAVVQRGRIRGSQTVVENRSWAVDSFREGVPVRTELFPERAQAIRAAGLSE